MYLRLLSPCLVFGTIKCFNSHQWCVNLPRGARQPAPHMGQVDAGGTVSHNILYNTQHTTILVIFLNAYVSKLYNLECVHAMVICENNTVFAKSDSWSKMRQPAPVSPTMFMIMYLIETNVVLHNKSIIRTWNMSMR